MPFEAVLRDMASRIQAFIGTGIKIYHVMVKGFAFTMQMDAVEARGFLPRLVDWLRRAPISENLPMVPHGLCGVAGVRRAVRRRLGNYCARACSPWKPRGRKASHTPITTTRRTRPSAVCSPAAGYHAGLEVRRCVPGLSTAVLLARWRASQCRGADSLESSIAWVYLAGGVHSDLSRKAR